MYSAPRAEEKKDEVVSPSSFVPAEKGGQQASTAPSTTADKAAPAAAAAASKSADNSETAPTKTRLLKDVETEENRYIYEALYKSLDDETDAGARDKLTVGDTVHEARKARQEFLRASSLPLKDKLKGFAALMRNMSEERNKKVAYVFIVYSLLILTLPLFMLMLGMHVLAPRWDFDATYCGGGLAVGTAFALVVSYVVNAVREDIIDFKRKAEREAEERKKK